MTSTLLLKQIIKQNEKKIIEFEKSIEILKAEIHDTEQKLIDLCDGHVWILDEIDYDRVYYKCSKNCGAWK